MFDNTMSVEQWKEQKQTERNDAFKAQQSGMEEFHYPRKTVGLFEHRSPCNGSNTE